MWSLKDRKTTTTTGFCSSKKLIPLCTAALLLYLSGAACTSTLLNSTAGAKNEEGFIIASEKYSPSRSSVSSVLKRTYEDSVPPIDFLGHS